MEYVKSVARSVLEVVRPEEWVLSLVLLTVFLLCISSFTGFDFIPVFREYVGYFSSYFFAFLVLSRGVVWIRISWVPETRFGQWVYSILGGSIEQQGGLLKTDIEFLRGATLLLISLTFYSNIKTRIPFIAGERYDEAYLAMDHALFGQEASEWIITTVSKSPWLIEWLQSIYLHGYKFMVILVLFLFVRFDRFELRWLFTSVCFTYLIGILITILYPSMGPVYVEPGAFEWLQGTDIKKVQDNLWEFMTSSVQAIGNGESFQVRAFAGIAAFPSLHIAHMVILIVVAARTIRWYAYFLMFVSFCTFVATIAFGWHYIVCAVGGFLLAVIVTEGLYWLLPREAGARENAT